MEKYIDGKFVDLTIADELRLESFIKDIEAVYVKHNMSILHEDSHGDLIVEENEERNMTWLKDCTFLAYNDEYHKAKYPDLSDC